MPTITPLQLELPKSPLVETDEDEITKLATIEKTLYGINLFKEKKAKDLPILFEEIPVIRVDALMRCEYVKSMDNWDNSLHKSDPRRMYENETQQLQRYKKNFVASQGFKVKYKQPQYKKGRPSPEFALGTTSMRKKIRNTLIQGIYLDFDIKNAQVEVMRQLADTLHLDSENLTRYCSERSEILLEIAKHYNIKDENDNWNTKAVKELFITYCFGGGFHKWSQKYGLDNVVETSYLKQFKGELETLMNIIYANNTDKKNEESIVEVANKKAKQKKLTDKKAPIRSAFGIFNQEKEWRIVSTIFQECKKAGLLNHTTNPKLNSGIYQYDGLLFHKNNVEAFDYEGECGIPAVCLFMKDITRKYTGFELEWINKPILKEDTIDITKEIELVNKDKDKINKWITYFQNLIKKSHRGVMDTLKEEFPDYFNYCVARGKWFCWNDKRNRFETNSFVITDKINEWLLPLVERKQAKYCENENGSPLDEKQEKLYAVCNALIAKLCDTNFQQNIVKQGVAICRVEIFECNKNPYLLGFNNGVLDFKENVFRPYFPADKMTMTTQYDMDGGYIKALGYEDQVGCDQTPKEEVVENIMYVEENIFEKIQPDFDEREYLKEILATGCLGIVIEKFFIWIGNGSNGKSLIADLMGLALGDYAKCDARPQIITDKSNKKSADGATSSLMGLESKRFVFMEEGDANDKINTSTMKAYTGTLKHSGRGLYKSSDISVEIPATWGITTNSRMDLDTPNPTNGERRRIVEMFFKSTFVETEDELEIKIKEGKENVYLQDTELKNNIQKYILPFLAILIQKIDVMSKRETKNYTPIAPKSVINKTNEYLLNTNPIVRLLNELYIFDENIPPMDAKSSKTIFNEIKESEEYGNMSRFDKEAFTSSKIKTLLTSETHYKKYLHYNTRNKSWTFFMKLKNEDQTDDE